MKHAKVVKRMAALTLLTLLPLYALATKPACHVHNGIPYCQYTGKVAKSYVNGGNQILLYFDTAFGSVSEITIPNVTVTNACMVLGNSGMDFAKMFYASILSAQATGRNVTVQMWSESGGYPRCDRVWVEE